MGQVKMGYFIRWRGRVRVCAMLEHQLAAIPVGVVGEEMMMIELKKTKTNDDDALMNKK